MDTMKVDRKDSDFKPVVITLESQEEVDTISIIMGCIGGRPDHSPRQYADKLYYELVEFASKDIPKHSGSVDFEDY